VQDVTHNSRTEEKIRRLNRSLREQSKRLEEANQELGAFTASASHDLRAPLRAIKGFSAALLEDYSPRIDDMGKEYLNRIIRAGRTMEELIDSLLQFAHLREMAIRSGTVDLSALANGFSAELKAGESDRNVEFKIQEKLVVSADPELMKIVIQNLIRNAWKFTAAKAEARIEFGCIKQDPIPCYYVRDNGVGFDMAYAHKLFQPFQRLHSASDFPGSGIGLAMVRRILSRHDGKIWAQSEVGQGTTFYFTLGT
jgi:signal transduction histidine kinase